MRQKKSLILLPGLLCDAELYGAQIQHLQDIADIKVIDFSTADSIDAMAQLVLEQAPPQFSLAGLSMGGYIAFEIMRRAPQRVERLCLMNTRAGMDSHEQLERRHGLMNLAEMGEFKGITPRLLPMMISAHSLEKKIAGQKIMAMAERMGKDAFIRQQLAVINRSDSRSTLADIGCPTLVIAGREDQITPLAHLQEIADGIGNSRLALLENCGHLSPIEQPEAVTTLIRLWFQANNQHIL
ncbi:MAG: alpha/beta fold hydrolase [Alphaproteobacteria bacterium]